MRGKNRPMIGQPSHSSLIGAIVVTETYRQTDRQTEGETE